MEGITEIEYLKREIDLLKQTKRLRLLECDPFTFGFMFAFGTATASLVMTILVAIPLMIIGFDIVNVILSNFE